MSLRIIVGIGMHNKSGRLEERTMVFPARIADPDLGGGKKTAQEIRPNSQSACAAWGLNSNSVVSSNGHRLRPEHQVLHLFSVCRRSINGKICLGVLPRAPAILRFTD